MIHVVAFVRRDVIGEELKRDDFYNRQQQLRRRRDVKHVLGDGGDFFVSFRSDRDQRALARADFSS